MNYVLNQIWGVSRMKYYLLSGDGCVSFPIVSVWSGKAPEGDLKRIIQLVDMCEGGFADMSPAS